MKYTIVLALGMCSLAYGATDSEIVIEPLPPVGSEISKPEEGVIQLKMDKPGTVILGHCKVEALPENYIIIFTAKGMATELSGGDIALVIYASDDNAVAGRAYGGSNMISTSSQWSHLKTSYLAKGTKQYREIIVGMHCDAPCKVQLRDFKVSAITRAAYEEEVARRRAKGRQIGTPPPPAPGAGQSVPPNR